MKLAVYVSEPFQKALNKLAETQLPVKTSFKLSKYIKDMATEAEVFNAQRQKIFTEFGKPVEGKEGMLQLDVDRQEEWLPKITELNELESTAEFKLKLDDLGDKAELTASDLLVLQDLVEE